MCLMEPQRDSAEFVLPRYARAWGWNRDFKSHRNGRLYEYLRRLVRF
jgi:hypothetical protein